MNQDQDMEMQEMMEELGEDLGRNRKQDENLGGGKIGSDFMHQGRTLILLALGFLILVAFFTIFLGNRNKISKKDLSAITIKLDQMEKQLNLLAGIEKKTDYLENQVKKLQKSVSNLDRSSSSLKGQQDQLAKRIDRLQNMKSPVAAKTKPPPAVKKKGNAQAEKRYHVVRRGETLFLIAKKYGIPLNELRRLNNITKSRIYPGQKLLISPAKHE